MKNKINIIYAPTASGKTKLAVAMAKKIENAVIINADAMQIYKEIPILTAQPTIKERSEIEHRLYGNVSCADEFSVAKWLKCVTKEIDTQRKEGRPIILVGGNGLYIKMLVYGMSDIPDISPQTKEHVKSLLQLNDPFDILKERDSASAATLQRQDHQRIIRALEVYEQTGTSIEHFHRQGKVIFYERQEFHLMTIDIAREILYQQINARFCEMLDLGIISEIENLLLSLPNAKYPKAHGLYEAIDYINKKITIDEMIQLSQRNTRHYAKRQLNWIKNHIDFDETISATQKQDLLL